jgi:hypothetical protein
MKGDPSQGNDPLSLRALRQAAPHSAGARWLPPAPWVHWITATLWVGAMFCIVIW